MDKNLWISALMVFLYPVFVAALRDVYIIVPSAVKRGDSAILQCRYDMEGDSLYSVKWYKGRREFFRYTPKENPPVRIFSVPGIHVNRQMSNESQIMLASVQPSTSAKYSCEVSADAPSFHTLIFSGDLEVVETPEGRPIISGFRSKYKPGDIVRGNCSSRHSRPASNLTWSINESPASPAHVRYHKPIKDHKSDLETSVLGLHFVVNHQHFIHGKLKIRCTAKIHDIYWQTTEKSFEEDRPRVFTAAASSSSNGNNVNLLQNIPYDQYSSLHLDNDINDKFDPHLTHIQGDMSSFTRAASSCSFKIIIYANLLPIVLLALFRT